ncbi:hypothetical protein L208DRAFT_1402671 [Tricholoma matsutake]|nr:hypothetical protein L208DRAFT_1402671 [Tricholoma matsutake 945]
MSCWKTPTLFFILFSCFVASRQCRLQITLYSAHSNNAFCSSALATRSPSFSITTCPNRSVTKLDLMPTLTIPPVKIKELKLPPPKISMLSQATHHNAIKFVGSKHAQTLG